MKKTFIIGLAALGVFTALKPDANAGVSIHFSFGLPPAPIVHVPAPCPPPFVVAAPCPPPVIVYRPPVCAPAPVIVAPAPCPPRVVVTHGHRGWGGYRSPRGYGYVCR